MNEGAMGCMVIRYVNGNERTHLLTFLRRSRENVMRPLKIKEYVLFG